MLEHDTTTALLAPSAALPQIPPPDQVGQWSPEYHWFDSSHYSEITHLALLPTGPEAGSVLLWRNCRCSGGFGCPENTCDEEPLDPGPCPPLPQVDHRPQVAQGYLWQPSAPGSLLTGPGIVRRNIFCAGHAFLPDGRLLVVGGSQPRASQCIPFPNYSFLFNTLVPFENPAIGYSPWSARIDLFQTANPTDLAYCENRYYPSIVVLGDGTLIAAGGGLPRADDAPYPMGCPQNALPYPESPGFAGGFSNSYQFFDPATASWGAFRPALPPGPPNVAETPQVEDRSLHFYPLMHVLSDPDAQGGSRLFVAQAGTHGFKTLRNREAYVIETGTNAVDMSPPPSRHTRKYAASVLLPKMDPAALDEVMIFGGALPFTCTAYGTAERIAIPPPGQPWPTDWTEVQMAPPGEPAITRMYPMTVLLPDGTVFVVGGVDKDYQHVGGEEPPDSCEGLDVNPCVQFDSILDPFIYDPTAGTAGTFASMASHESTRIYHSCALLLRDGRVLVAGGERNAACAARSYSDAEIFSPPYLFKGQRPELVRPLPASIPYGEQVEVTVKTRLTDDIQSAVLVYPSEPADRSPLRRRSALDTGAVEGAVELPRTRAAQRGSGSSAPWSRSSCQWRGMSSSIRLAGCVQTRTSTSARYAKGSTPAALQLTRIE